MSYKCACRGDAEKRESQDSPSPSPGSLHQGRQTMRELSPSPANPIRGDTVVFATPFQFASGYELRTQEVLELFARFCYLLDGRNLYLLACILSCYIDTWRNDD